MEESARRLRGNERPLARLMPLKRTGKRLACLGTNRVSRRRRQRQHASRSATRDQHPAPAPSLQHSNSDLAESPAPTHWNKVVTSSNLSDCNHGSAYSPRATVRDAAGEERSGNAPRDKATLQPNTGIRLGRLNDKTADAAPSAHVALTEPAPQPSIDVSPPKTQPSSISLVSPSVPAEGRGVVDAVHKDGRQAPPVGQARVEFLYRVGYYRYPELQSFSWKPEGSFQNKTLAELVDELPTQLERSQFEYLYFRLTAPKARAEHLVSRGREDHFDALKRHLVGIIRDCIADAPCGERLLVEFDIELLADKNSVRKSWTDKEVADFEW